MAAGSQRTASQRVTVETGATVPRPPREQLLTLWCFEGPGDAARALDVLTKNSPALARQLVEHVRFVHLDGEREPKWKYQEASVSRARAGERSTLGHLGHAMGSVLGRGLDIGRGRTMEDAFVQGGVPDDVEDAALAALRPETSALLVLSETTTLPVEGIHGLSSVLARRVRRGKVTLGRGFGALVAPGGYQTDNRQV